MICDEDPLWRRPMEPTSRKKRREGCVWMAEYMGKWPSNRGLISKIRPSDGYGRNAVLLALKCWYNFRECGCHMGNVG